MLIADTELLKKVPERPKLKMIDIRVYPDKCQCQKRQNLVLRYED